MGDVRQPDEQSEPDSSSEPLPPSVEETEAVAAPSESDDEPLTGVTYEPL